MDGNGWQRRVEKDGGGLHEITSNLLGQVAGQGRQFAGTLRTLKDNFKDHFYDLKDTLGTTFTI